MEERNYSTALTATWLFGHLAANLRSQIHQASKTWPLRGLCRQTMRGRNSFTSRVTGASQHSVEDQVEKTVRSEDVVHKASSPRPIVQGREIQKRWTLYLLSPLFLNRTDKMISMKKPAAISQIRNPVLRRKQATCQPTTLKIPCRRLVYSPRNLLSSSNPQLYRVNEAPMIKAS